jgi:hypothetical protein
MNGLTINIDWPYFLGIVGTLVGMAYYANGRLTKIETTVEWLKELLLELRDRLDDRLTTRPEEPNGLAKSVRNRGVTHNRQRAIKVE